MSFACEYCREIHCQHNCSQQIAYAVKKERERILAIVEEESTHYSKVEETLKPSILAAVFANAVMAKAKGSP